jgi:hypothetical protein
MDDDGSTVAVLVDWSRPAESSVSRQSGRTGDLRDGGGPCDRGPYELDLRGGVFHVDLVQEVTRVPHRKLAPDEGRHSDPQPNREQHTLMIHMKPPRVP